MVSKLGFHIQQRRQSWPNAVADAVPALVKTLEWSLLDEWIPEEQFELIKIERARKWRDGRVFLLGRQFKPTQHLDHPVERALEFWNYTLDTLSGFDDSRRPLVLERMRLFDAWEGYNEIGSGEDAAELGRFDAALARIFHGEGTKYAGGGFSTTKPTDQDWPLYYSALLDAVASGRGDRPDFLHFHEYWYPPTDWRGLLEPDGRIDAARMREVTEGHVLHWRELYRDAKTPREIRLPVIISECGWDRGRPEQLGFRESQLSDAEYLKWLIWYDDELQVPLDGIDYVVGAAIYTYGHTQRWSSFEIDEWQGRGILDSLRLYLRQENREPHPWAWQAAWGEEEAEWALSHYLLLGPDISLAWRHALDRYLHTFHPTNGQSVDDASARAGARHHITLVGHAKCAFGVPAAWEDEIRRRHPEVRLDRMDAPSVSSLQRTADDRARRNDRYGERSW